MDRLKDYRSRLVVFPRKSGKPKAGDAQGDDLTAHITRTLPALPPSAVAEKPRAITDEEKEFQAYKTLREERASKRYEGARKKREAAKAAEEAAVSPPCASSWEDQADSVAEEVDWRSRVQERLCILWACTISLQLLTVCDCMGFLYPIVGWSAGLLYSARSAVGSLGCARAASEFCSSRIQAPYPCGGPP